MRRLIPCLALAFACASRATPSSAPSSDPSLSAERIVAPAGGAAASAGAPAATSAHAEANEAADAAQQILDNPALSAYHGWIRYLEFQAAHAAERFRGDPAAAQQARARLSDWTARIGANPALLSELRGVTEWAYLSPVDGSGQPFKFNIPTDYDPQRPAPVALYMHGYSGNHLEHATGMKDHAGYFEVSVLGRSRGGRYRALSEADVLHVLDYLAAHWAIDPERVHLDGGSMGGGGTFWLGSRYPQRFASGRPVCGYASDKPIGNLLTFPIYATHSDDDWQVPVLHARGPLSKLRALGGQATLDETTGLGHAAWNYEQGNARAAAWFPKQVRPASKDVRRLDFTALDGDAVRAFWVEIAEWGNEPLPARFALDVGKKNRAKLQLDNIQRLTLRLAESPFDAQLALRLTLQDGAVVELPAPLPAQVTLARGEKAWAFESGAPDGAVRLHTPGGANRLYAGEPLLIVYGTAGGATMAAALRAAAEVARKSSNATWPAPNGETGADGVAHNQNLYGELEIKPDTAVTADDIARRHLVLIGSAAQNSLVTRLAARLPVQYGDQIVFSDGSELDSLDRALGLVYYNPEAPQRLVFWVAANDPAAYAQGSLVPELLGAPATGVDCVVTRVSDPALVVSRSFDSRWHWQEREGSPLLPDSLQGRAALARAVASAVRRAAPADFALVGLPAVTRTKVYEPGQARLVDLVAQSYYEPVSVMTLTGSELRTALGILLEKSELRLEPEPDLAQLQAKREYKLALSAQQISPLVALTHLAPRKYQVTDTTVAQALLRYGVSSPSAARASSSR